MVSIVRVLHHAELGTRVVLTRHRVIDGWERKGWPLAGDEDRRWVERDGIWWVGGEGWNMTAGRWGVEYDGWAVRGGIWRLGGEGWNMTAGRGLVEYDRGGGGERWGWPPDGGYTILGGRHFPLKETTTVGLGLSLRTSSMIPQASRQTTSSQSLNWYRATQTGSLIYHTRQNSFCLTAAKFVVQLPKTHRNTEKKTAGCCDSQGWCNYDIYRAQFRFGTFTV